MVSPEQRMGMHYRVREFRNTKDVFAMDFHNDGEFVQGCIAGGRRYLHINAAGDVDPCVFVHFSDSNIHDKTLLECLQSPLFMAYHDGQPFNDNMLRPCPLLENPQALREMIARTEDLGVADGRWKLAGDAAFAQAIGVELDSGEAGRFAFTLMPQWVKARWTDCALQPSKLYHLAKAGISSPREDIQVEAGC